jgi:hypothetical protein
MADYTNMIQTLSSSSLSTVINTNTHNALTDEESAITVNSLSRTFSIPTSFTKMIGIKNDHNSNAITFHCPRYIDGYDILKCSQKVIKWYNVAASVAGVYQIEDMQVRDEDSSMVEFSWIIAGAITSAAGRLQFSLEYIDVNKDEDSICYRWNTTVNGDLSIGDGLYNANVDGSQQIGDTGTFEIIFVEDTQVNKMLQEVYNS